MPFQPTDLIRSDLDRMEAYTPIVPFEVLSARLGYPPDQIVKLDANENPYGPSPKVYEALAREPFYHIYPDPDSQDLRDALSQFLKLDRAYILAGSGADELIDVVLRLFIQPGDRIINCPPTFGMYSFLTEVAGGTVLKIPRHADFVLDLDGIEQAVYTQPQPKLIFVTSPNNPDGSILPDDHLRRLLSLPIMVVLDEAYVEFHGESRVHWVREYPNLIVLRTFSKWAGLAGLRVGYGAFPLNIITHLWKIKQPYNVNVAAKTAALAALADVEYLFGNVRKMVAERDRLYQALTQIPFLRPYPSRSNFILCQVLERDAHQLKDALAQQGILVRYYASAGLRDHIRVSVGLPEHTDRLIQALKEMI